MEESESVARLQGLQADLLAFSESRLPNLERLWAELEDSIEDFRKLLDKQQRNDKSRQALAANTIKFGELEYTINEEFRQEAIQVADALDLDELDAASLYIASQDGAQELDRPPALAAVLQFHGRRETLLACWRMSVQQAADHEIDEQQREIFAELTRLVIRGPDGNHNSASTYWRKCVSTMGSIEQWIRALDERLQGAAIIGQSAMGYALEALAYQRSSLMRQHESLGAIVCHLVKAGHVTIDDFRFLMTKTATLDRVDDLVLHYAPVLLSCASCFGPTDGSSTFRDARSLDQTFADKSDRSRWRLPDFRAASTAWWLAEYSSRYSDNPSGSPLQGVDLDAESESRASRFMETLRDGAFQFMLFLCSQVRTEMWHDPAKVGLVTFLLNDMDKSRNGPLTAADYFQELLAQQLQLFVDALITNMPDTIRRLKFEEDEQRRNMGPQLPQAQQESTLHLERFLVIMSYSFQGFPDAAHEAFWSDPDGNMYGFLQWASKRQSTPRVAAFCEMFRSIAESEDCADAAHRFLLDETSSTAKLRKGASLCWAQIFGELGYYATSLQERPSVLSMNNDNGVLSQTDEPESALMLECYLRLSSHMVRTSANAREYILSHETVHLHEILFDLAKSGIDSRFKACAFDTLTSMLTAKIPEVGNAMWEALDGWIFGIPTMKPGSVKTVVAQQGNTTQAVAARLNAIASGFEEPNAFVGLLQSLLVPPPTQYAIDDALPFPEQLGLAYRMPGIDQYVDFALEGVFKNLVVDLHDTDHLWELRCTCLDFIATCLSTFNEDLVIFANSTNISVDAAISTSTLAVYVRQHPFARVMEWLFNDGIIAAIFAAAHENVDVVGAAQPGSPLVLSLCRSIQVIDLTLKLQSTYFDIVRPVVKTQSAVRSKQVANPALASFEDAILGNVNLIGDLGLYCGTGHQDLTILSVQLLQKLAVSRKLAVSSTSLSGGRTSASRVLTALQQDSDIERIASAFIAPLQLDQRELEMGDAAPGFAIKQAILDLVDSSLDLSPNKPTLAHCLLGFSCGDSTVAILPDRQFAKGASLFHAIARLCAETVSLEDCNVVPWLSSISASACSIVRKLVKSPMTGPISTDELRESGFNEALALAQRSITPDTEWCGKRCKDADFLVSDSASTFCNFLDRRAAFFENASLQLREASQRKSPNLRQKALSSLLGKTVLPTGEQVQNASVFELFDFVDLDIAAPYQVPSFTHMNGLDFGICRRSDPSASPGYDLRLARELLLLRQAELRKGGKLTDATAEQQSQAEIDASLLTLQSQNQYAAILGSQRSTLSAWVQLVTLMLVTGEMEPATKSAFILQALQNVLPKMDKNINDDSLMTLPMAKLVYALVQAADSGLAGQPGREGNVAAERLLHAFRTSLRGVGSATSNVDLRETCYQTSRHFLKTVASDSRGKTTVAKQCLKVLENAGERLVDTICEDALSGQGTCRIAALLMLESGVQLFQTGKSAYMTKSLTRLNFVSVLVDSIRGIALEFEHDQQGKDLPSVLAYVHTGLALLLRLSQDNAGAAAILDAGLFSSIRDSQLFATDPDIGLDVDNPEALENFYRLLVAILRIIISIIVTKGPKNNQISSQGRNFLLENRQCMQAIFKAAARSDRLSLASRQSLDELVDGFTVLICATGFLELDDKPTGQQTARGFS